MYPEHPTEIVVDHEAIRANTRLFHSCTPGTLMAVLKADAFGHGDVTSTVLGAGATWIGVTSVAEALSIRATDGGANVPILSWLNPVDTDFAAAVCTHVDLAVPALAHLDAIAAAARQIGRRARVHLHADVGIGRDGAPINLWPSLCRRASELENLGLVDVIGVMGHMSTADDPSSPQNALERLLFGDAVRTVRKNGLRPRHLHLAATAATLTGTGGAFDMVRVGAGLFGIDPTGTTHDLRPALSLNTSVITAHPADRGTGIGYGHTHVTAERTNLALLPVGYGDGLPRTASGRAEVTIRGRRRPLVGRFSMDMIVVDTGDDALRPGEPVQVFGGGGTGGGNAPTVAEWAAWSGTIEQDIVTSIGIRAARLPRRAVNTQPLPMSGVGR